MKKMIYLMSAIMLASIISSEVDGMKKKSPDNAGIAVHTIMAAMRHRIRESNGLNENEKKIAEAIWKVANDYYKRLNLSQNELFSLARDLKAACAKKTPSELLDLTLDLYCYASDRPDVVFAQHFLRTLASSPLLSPASGQLLQNRKQRGQYDSPEVVKLFNTFFRTQSLNSSTTMQPRPTPMPSTSVQPGQKLTSTSPTSVRAEQPSTTGGPSGVQDVSKEKRSSVNRTPKQNLSAPSPTSTEGGVPPPPPIGIEGNVPPPPALETGKTGLGNFADQIAKAKLKHIDTINTLPTGVTPPAGGQKGALMLGKADLNKKKGELHKVPPRGETKHTFEVNNNEAAKILQNQMGKLRPVPKKPATPVPVAPEAVVPEAVVPGTPAVPAVPEAVVPGTPEAVVPETVVPGIQPPNVIVKKIRKRGDLVGQQIPGTADITLRPTHPSSEPQLPEPPIIGDIERVRENLRHVEIVEVEVEVEVEEEE
ncbi:MAG: hypothetical protein LBB29_00670 [Holosporaceae bacterium]|nr:hypothetical protein [Holosporaceae bacterium]